MVGVLVAVGGFLYLRLGSELLNSIDVSLRARAQTIAHGIEGGAIAVGGSSQGFIDPDEALAQVLDSDGVVLDATEGVAGAPLLPTSTLEQAPRFVDGAIPTLETEDRYRMLVVRTQSASGAVYVVVGATLSDRQEAMEQLLLLMAIGGPATLLVSGLAGWVLAGAALRPVERMRQEAEAISVSEPDRRLPVPEGDDELARLGTTLNAMLDRLQDAFERERRFVDEASHELRTPLAVLKAELELAVMRERTPAELTESLRSASREADRLTHLAEDLLVLARADSGKLPVRRVDTRVDELLEATADAWRPRVAAAGIRIAVGASALSFPLDPTRIRQALDNLIDNALRHGQPSLIRLRASFEGALVLTVEDDGAPIPPEIIAVAFEPFTGSRADGAGLGLAVVRAVAEAHGGSVIADNGSEGVSVSLRLPDSSAAG